MLRNRGMGICFFTGSSRPLCVPSNSKTSQNYITELSDANMPTGTGRGPFIELPEFKPLGDPTFLLSIKLPQGSTLNLKDESIITICGDVKSLTAIRKEVNRTIYEELSTSSPACLLLSGGTSGYSLIQTESNFEKWHVLHNDNVVAWAGLTFNISDTQMFDKSNCLKSENRGTMVLNSRHRLYKITLDQDEDIVVSPNSLIATTVIPTPLFLSSNRELRRVKLLDLINFSRERFNSKLFSSGSLVVKSASNVLMEPFKNVGDSIKNGILRLDSKKFLYKYYSKTKQVLGWLSLNLTNRLFRRSPIYLQVRGPAKIVFNNASGVPNSKFFSAKEIESIKKTK